MPSQNPPTKATKPSLALGTRVLQPPPRPSPPGRTRTFTSSYNLFGPAGLGEDASQAPAPTCAPTSPIATSGLGGARPRKKPALRLDVRHLEQDDQGDTGGEPESGTSATAILGDARRVLCLCESPSALDASDDEAPSPTTISPTRPRRATSFTFGDHASYSPEIARASTLAFTNTDALTDFGPLKADPCATPKSILKKQDSGSIMSGSSSVLSLGTPPKRVTWSDQGSSLTLEAQRTKNSLRLPVRVGSMGRSIRRHSTDAATRLRTAAGSVASASRTIPGFAFLRGPWEYYYPPSEDEEEPERVRPASPDIDWIAAGRAYTEEDLHRDFPPLAAAHGDDSIRIRTRRGRTSVTQRDRRPSLSRSRSAPVRGRHSTRADRAPSDASDASESSQELHWDARRFKVPAGVLEGRYRSKGPELDEPDEEVHAALAPPDDRQLNHRNASTSNDTLPSLDSSFLSVDSEGPSTPSGSILLQPRASHSAEMPDGAVVIAPRQRKGPRPPQRAYTAW